MKFLKNNLKLIIGFILGAILTGGIVYAAVASASEIDYTTTKNSSVKNVEQALNDLYLKSQNSGDYEYIEFNHEANTQYDYDFGFVPQSFFAYFHVSGKGNYVIQYNVNSNQLTFVDYGNDDCSEEISLDSTKLTSTFPTSWYAYKSAYTIYVFASK